MDKKAAKPANKARKPKPAKAAGEAKAAKEAGEAKPSGKKTGSQKKDEKKTRLRRDVTSHLAAERIMARMTQEEMAEALGTSKSSISRIESGGQNLTVDYIQAMAEALQKNVSFVMEDPRIEYGDESEYSLKLYDEELIRFRMKRGVSLHAEIVYVNDDRKNVFPMDLELTEEGLLEWLRRRVVPGNRELVGSVLHSLGLTMGNLKGIIDVCMGLSLNDSYWIPQSNFTGSFAQYNLYQNRFDEALSLIAYLGRGSRRKKYGTTPELTTGGMLRKAWHFSDRNGIWLYKSGTSGYANAGNEPYSEFMAYQIARRMGLHAVPYELANWYGILASKCKLFTDIDTSFIPAGRVVKTGGIDACLDYYKNLGDDFYQELVSMLIFDAVIVNEDRHFGNFGLLRDNHTGEIISPAPIFDNGLSLLCYGMKKEFIDDTEYREYLAGRTNPYGEGSQFMDLARRIIGPVQKGQLRRLAGFTFEESDVTNLPRWRTQRLEEMVRDRAKAMLAM